jgi:hypothetical protein
MVQRPVLKRYTRLTGKDANFSGIGFTHLRPLRKNPFGPLRLKGLFPLGLLAITSCLLVRTKPACAADAAACIGASVSALERRTAPAYHHRGERREQYINEHQ